MIPKLRYSVIRLFGFYPLRSTTGLGNVVNIWLATLPMALPSKLFLHFSLNQAILSKIFFGGNAIGNIAKEKSAALSRADDSGHYRDLVGTR